MTAPSPDVPRLVEWANGCLAAFGAVELATRRPAVGVVACGLEALEVVGRADGGVEYVSRRRAATWSAGDRIALPWGDAVREALRTALGGAAGDIREALIDELFDGALHPLLSGQGPVHASRVNDPGSRWPIETCVLLACEQRSLALLLSLCWSD